MLLQSQPIWHYLTAKWSSKLKTAVDNSTKDQSQRDHLYDQYWSSLAASGFSSAAQAQAARQILALTPSSQHTPSFESFASTDIESLRGAEADIWAAINGQNKLSNKFSVPPHVAAQIIASELRKQSIDESGRQEFMKKFEIVWGTGGKGDLGNRLNAHPQVMDLHGMAAGRPGN
jgi:hypothetical protein